MSRLAALLLCCAYLTLAWGGLAPRRAAAQDNPFDPFDDTTATADVAPFAEPPAAATPFDAPPRSARPKHLSTAELENKIRAALAGPTTLDFTETPLQDAVEYLKDLHGVEIQLDTRALEDAAIGSDSPVTRMLNGLSLASALRLMLDDLDCTYVVQDGVLLLTSKAAAQKMVDLRVYNVSDLVETPDGAQRLAEVVRSLFGDPKSGVAGGGRVDENEGTGEKGARAACVAAGRFEVLPYRDLLVVQASQHDHEAITRLLDDIRSKLRNRD